MHFLRQPAPACTSLAFFYTAFNLPFGVYVPREIVFLAVSGEIVDAARWTAPW